VSAYAIVSSPHPQNHLLAIPLFFIDTNRELHMQTMSQFFATLIRKLTRKSKYETVDTTSETIPEQAESEDFSSPSPVAEAETSATTESTVDSAETIAAQMGLSPNTVPRHILDKAPARRSVSTGIANESLQEMVFSGPDRFVRLRNYSGAIDNTGPVWSIDFSKIEPERISSREQRKQEPGTVDWDTLYALTEVENWDEFCAHFFPTHLGHIAAYLHFTFSRSETRDTFLAILQRLLEEGRLVHAQPGKTINELRRASTRPLPLWGAPPEVMAHCYRLHWPDLKHVDYVNQVVSYCAWYMQFAWVAWDEQLLVASGLADSHRPGGIWYDGCEYVKAGDWTILPYQKESAKVVDYLPLRRHLARLGFTSIEALARFHFGSAFSSLLRELQLEALPPEEMENVVLALLNTLLRDRWLVHADPCFPWRQQLVRKNKPPLRSWQPDPQLLLDCLRIHWPIDAGAEENDHFLCDLFEHAAQYSFAWVAKGRHKGNWVKEGDDTPGSLWYENIEIAKPGEWE